MIVGPIFKVNATISIVPSSIMQLIVLHDSLVVDALYQIIRFFFINVGYTRLTGS